jgi:guanylate kinase
MSLVFVVSGPSGVGKGTLCKKLLDDHPDLGLSLSVSMTTRPPRAGEVHGQHYTFVSKDEFLKTVQQGGMLEWAEYNAQLYGTPVQAVERHLQKGQPVLLEIEPQGAFQVKKQFGSKAKLIFILPPSLEVLLDRLKKRGTNTPSDIENRFSIAQNELEQKKAFDFHVINDQLKQAVDTLANTIRECLKQVDR